MKKIFGLFLLFGVFSTSFAEKMAPLEIPSTRSMGMGGTHVAYTDDVFALFVNPAALQRANQGSAFEISPAFVGPLFELSDLLSSIDGDIIGAVGDFTKKTKGKLPIGFELRGPLSIGYTANGMGFGIWDRVSVQTSFIGTDLKASVLADMILNFGMSFRVLSLENHEVDAGFVVKPFVRGKADLKLSAMDAAVGGTDSLLDDLNVPLIFGAGLDLGFMYRFYEALAVGMTIDDVFTGGGRISTIYGTDDGVSFYQVPITLNLGVAYTLQPIPWLSLAFMLDYRDLTNLFFAGDYTRKNPILNLAFGTEIGILSFLKLRFGLDEMLPTAGIGLVAKAFQLNFAIYGRELSNEPGDFSTYGVDIGISVRPGTKKKTWPWSNPIVNSIIGLPVYEINDEAEAEAAANASLNELDGALSY
jgi:hypothetical protein